MKFMNVVMIIALLVATDSFTREVSSRTRTGATGTSTETKRSSAKAVMSSSKAAEESVSENKVIESERKKIALATQKTEKIIADARNSINVARANLANNTITAVQAAKEIGKHNYRIKQAEKNLAKLVQSSVDKVEAVDAEKSYMQQLIAPFKAGYGYTQKEKDIAQATLAELRQQRIDVTRTYEQAMQKKLTAPQKRKLQNNYKVTMQKIAEEIYQQQLITGEVMSTSRKLFWATVGLAGTVIGGAVAQQMLTKETSAPTPTTPTMPTTEAGKAEKTESLGEKFTRGLKNIKEYASGTAASLEKPVGKLVESAEEKAFELAKQARLLTAKKEPQESQEAFETRITQQIEKEKRISKQFEQQEQMFAQEAAALRQAKEEEEEKMAAWYAAHPDAETLEEREARKQAREKEAEALKKHYAAHPEEVSLWDRIKAAIFGGSSESTPTTEVPVKPAEQPTAEKKPEEPADQKKPMSLREKKRAKREERRAR